MLLLIQVQVNIKFICKEEKQEKIRLEKIRQEKLRREKQQLEQKLAAQSENISKEQQAADKASQNRLSKLNDELNSSMLEEAEAKSFLAQVEQSKKEFVTKSRRNIPLLWECGGAGSSSASILEFPR